MRKRNPQFARCAAIGMLLASWMILAASWAASAHAQASDVPQTPESAGSTAQTASDQSADDPIITMFPHSQTARYWISGQDNIIYQYHPSFYAKYNGPHSFTPPANDATSNVSTLFLGYQLFRATEVYLDVEEASGGGLSDGLGLAGFVNLDVVRNPLLSKAPYIARVMIRQIIPLGRE